MKMSLTMLKPRSMTTRSKVSKGLTACTQPRAGFVVAVECESVNAIVTTVIGVVQ